MNHGGEEVTMTKPSDLKSEPVWAKLDRTFNQLVWLFFVNLVLWLAVLMLTVELTIRWEASTR